MNELSPLSSTLIFQREWGMTCASAPKSILYTTGIATCFMLTFYHPKTRLAALGHIDNATELSSLTAIIDLFKQFEIPTEEIKCTLIGGYKEVKYLQDDAAETKFILEQNGIKKIDIRGLFKKTAPSAKEYFQLCHCPETIPQNEIRKWGWNRGGIDAVNGKVFYDDLLVPDESDRSVGERANHILKIKDLGSKIFFPLWPHCNYASALACKLENTISGLHNESEKKHLQKLLGNRNYSEMLRQSTAASELTELFKLLLAHRAALGIDLKAASDFPFAPGVATEGDNCSATDFLQQCALQDTIQEAITKAGSSKTLQKSFDEQNFNLMLRQCSASPKQLEVLRILIENKLLLKIDVNTRGSVSGTALSIAIAKKNQEAITLLLQHEALDH